MVELRQNDFANEWSGQRQLARSYMAVGRRRVGRPIRYLRIRRITPINLSMAAKKNEKNKREKTQTLFLLEASYR